MEVRWEICCGLACWLLACCGGGGCSSQQLHSGSLFCCQQQVCSFPIINNITMGNCKCGESKQLDQSITQEMLARLSEDHKQIGFRIKVRTWQKETYSLFDYENSNQLKEESFNLDREGFLTRQDNKIIWRETIMDSYQENEIMLIQISMEDNDFIILNNRGRNLKEGCSKEHYDEEQQANNTELKKFKPFPIIPLQKQQLVHQDVQQGTQNLDRHQISQAEPLQAPSQSRRHHQNGQNQVQNSRVESCTGHIDSSEILADGNQCRVCLSTATSASNPLVNPCKCSGSMKYIHLQCLQKWLRSKLHSRQSEYCIIYMWSNLECELCKFNYPPVFKSDENVFDLVELSKPKHLPYLLLEITQQKYEEGNEEQGIQGVYIITFAEKEELKVGRAHEAEIRINDISVSRSHAVFKFVNNQVFLYDNKSKFGTLLLLQNNLTVSEQVQGLQLQVQRSVIEIQSRE